MLYNYGLNNNRTLSKAKQNKTKQFSKSSETN